ncbi:hypothetical protein OSB04_009991 [Centaurea solstitialis]|uniref:Uncharacterized protein n=1 Tax=Centaurea solstitialis TaxID=347529 RepID=A0AA38WCE6_9ASTR|nr:hypothetical protein OSB04_009991 [Centaurea solstitialis]
MSSTSHLIDGLSIQQAALTNDWDSVEPIFEQDTKSMTRRITCKGETPLMIAVGTNRSHDFVKRLVDRVVEVDDADKLFDTCDVGDNPLHRAARIGHTTDARVLVGVNAGMTLVPNKDGYRQLNLAAAHGNKHTVNPKQ